MQARHTVEWTEDDLAYLRKAWTTGEERIKICIKLGRSVGSVVGKAFRIGLGNRPRPEPQAKPQLRIAAVSRFATQNHHLLLPKRPAPKPKIAKKPMSNWGEKPRPERVPTVPKSPPRLTCASAVAEAVRDLAHCQCRWPIGDLESPNFHFCFNVKLEGKPYCSEHDAIASNKASISPYQRRLLARQVMWAAEKARSKTDVDPETNLALDTRAPRTLRNGRGALETQAVSADP